MADAAESKAVTSPGGAEVDTSGLLHSVHVAEFDILIGNTLSKSYPSFECVCSVSEGATKEAMGNLCLPDGAHLHEDDWTYMLLPGGLYGVSYFKNKRDATKKRGAVQKSVLLLLRRPVFDTVEPIMKAVLNRYLGTEVGDDEAKQAACVRDTFTALAPALESGATSTYPLSRTIDVTVPDNGVFGGASLATLVTRLREQTMLVWYSLMLQQRVLVCGHGIPARQVGQTCLATPLLAKPLEGFESLLCPYVALTDLDPIMRPAYICGTTNQLFATRKEWWDCLVDLASDSVTHGKGITVSGDDLSFIKRVLSGLELEHDDDAESWVRAQFKDYTSAVLKRAALGVDADGKTLSGQQKKWLTAITETPMYKALHRRRVGTRRKARTGATAYLSSHQLDSFRRLSVDARPTADDSDDSDDSDADTGEGEPGTTAGAGAPAHAAAAAATGAGAGAGAGSGSGAAGEGATGAAAAPHPPAPAADASQIQREALDAAVAAEVATFRALLQRGIDAVKYSRWGRPHIRRFMLDAHAGALQWRAPNESDSAAATAAGEPEAESSASPGRKKRRLSSNATPTARRMSHVGKELAGVAGAAAASGATAAPASGKLKSVHLADVEGVYKGKTTTILTKRGGSAPEDCCLSLVVVDHTGRKDKRESVDLEFGSKRDRDATAQGLLLLGLPAGNFVNGDFIMYHLHGSNSASGAGGGAVTPLAPVAAGVAGDGAAADSAAAPTPVSAAPPSLGAPAAPGAGVGVAYPEVVPSEHVQKLLRSGRLSVAAGVAGS